MIHDRTGRTCSTSSTPSSSLPTSPTHTSNPSRPEPSRSVAFASTLGSHPTSILAYFDLLQGSSMCTDQGCFSAR
eukprot:159389-Rhodomonas_salina.3